MHFLWSGRTLCRAPEDGGTGGGGGGGGAPPPPATPPAPTDLGDGRTQKALADDVAKLTAKVGKLAKLIEPDDDEEDEQDEEPDAGDDLGSALDEGIALLSGADDSDEAEPEAPRKKKGKAA